MPDPVEPAVPIPPADHTRDTADPINPTVAGMLSPLARSWVYAALGVLVPIGVLAAELFEFPGWAEKTVALVSSAATFAGFGLARSNTPVTRRP